MFSPSADDVRRFFVEAWRKRRSGAPATPIETIAADWIAEHPEHHDELAELDRALAARYDGSDGRSNPFLHLSMHLSISEQVSIDQPAGIRQALELLAARLGSRHAASTKRWNASAGCSGIRSGAVAARRRGLTSRQSRS
jgi:hypothetical protein